MTRRERLERRLERRKSWAAGARGRARGRFDAATQLSERFSGGQPILVGHHSEKRARRDQERMHRNMSKGCEEMDKAEHHAAKAVGLERQLERTIFSDDADAIERLEEKARAADESADHAVKVNRAWRKTKGQELDARITGLVSSGLVSQRLAETIAETMRLCPWLKSPLDSGASRAEARRCRERIAEIKRRAEKAAEAEAAGGVVVASNGEWCTVTFAEKPARTIINALKAAGFRWGRGSWHGRADRVPDEVNDV
jgi:hypothetical protein